MKLLTVKDKQTRQRFSIKPALVSAIYEANPNSTSNGNVVVEFIAANSESGLIIRCDYDDLVKRWQEKIN